MSDNTDKFADVRDLVELPKQWKSTQKGRVVYDREKHIFNSKDLWRIARKTKDRWETEPNQWIVKERIYLVSEYCAYYLMNYYLTDAYQVPAHHSLEQFTAILENFTISIIASIYDWFGLQPQVSDMLAEPTYAIIYKAVELMLGFYISGGYDGKKNR